MKPIQKQALLSMSKLACELKAESSAPSERMYVPYNGISNSYGWDKFGEIAVSVCDDANSLREDLSERSDLNAFLIKKALFDLALVQRQDDIFYDLCLNDYWLWSLVEAVAQAALLRKCFPISAACFVDAVESLTSRVPAIKFASLETTLIRVLSDRTGTRDLVERSMYLKRAVEDVTIPSLAELFRKSIGAEYLQEYLEHGLILVDDDRETDPHKADICFNKLLLLDWQLGQRGPVYARHEGLEVKKSFY